MTQVAFYILAVLKVIALVFAGYLLAYAFPWKQGENKNDRIGTIVIDHSDDEVNIFLEIENSDIEQWEDGKDYYVRVAIRDYVSQE